MLLAASAVVAAFTASAAWTAAHAQAPGQQTQIPPVNVTAPAETRRPSRPAAVRRADRGAPRPQPQRARPAEPQQPAVTAAGQSQDARTGTVGYYSNSTSVATKTNTPLVNIPQSV